MINKELEQAVNPSERPRRLRQRRLELGMTQVALAAKAGVTQSVISALERDKHAPMADTIRKLEAALDLPRGTLL